MRPAIPGERQGEYFGNPTVRREVVTYSGYSIERRHRRRAGRRGCLCNGTMQSGRLGMRDLTNMPARPLWFVLQSIIPVADPSGEAVETSWRYEFRFESQKRNR